MGGFDRKNTGEATEDESMTSLGEVLSSTDFVVVRFSV